MNSRRLNNIICELYKFNPTILEIKESIDDKYIRNFENKYYVDLPQEYKDLLNIHNGISLMGVEILGIDINNCNDLYNTYYFEHFEVDNPMPRHLIPFSPDGFGNHYCFDTNIKTIGGYSNQIVFWQHDYSYSKEETPEVTHESLVDFIKEVMIDWTLKDYDYNGNEI